MNLLHDEAGERVDEKAPYTGASVQLETARGDQIPSGGEHDLQEEAVQAVQVEATEDGQRSPSCGTGGIPGVSRRLYDVVSGVRVRLHCDAGGRLLKHHLLIASEEVSIVESGWQPGGYGTAVSVFRMG